MKKTAKVYQMNEIDWWCDYSKESALVNYYKFVGGKLEDPLDEPEELTKDDLERSKYYDDETRQTISFKEELEKRIQENNVPSFFASTEY